MARARSQRTSTSFAALGAPDNERILMAPGVLVVPNGPPGDTHEIHCKSLVEVHGDVEH